MSLSTRSCAVWLLGALSACTEPVVDATKSVAGDSADASGSDDDTATDPDDSATDTADTGTTEPSPAIVPLYGADTPLLADVVSDRGDAIVTRFADRGRDRHAREDQFQSYDHFLPHYWEYRTARFVFVDTVAKGGSTIELSFVAEWKLTVAEFRAWYNGRGSVAAYSGNYAPAFAVTGPGTFDEDHVQVDTAGHQYRYTFTLDHAIALDGTVSPLAVGQLMEIEVSQFLDAPPVGRTNYYGTTYLYRVGDGGMVPWQSVGSFEDPSSDRENSVPIDPAGWLGGGTTLPYAYSDEPDNHFMQMATNLSSEHGQPFVRGRRVHHTDMLDGTHDESADNPIFTELVGLGGPLYTHTSCDGCHHRNGRAPVAEVGEVLDAWVVQVATEDGEPVPELGAVLQPFHTSGAGEGSVHIAAWEEADGLRRPVYGWSIDAPAQYSARIAPQLVGIGLLEAIDESSVLSWEDPEDADGDGISGRARRVTDPVTGEVRLGRFGWKAGTSSVRHQTAAALMNDMGVRTSVFTDPDCGSAQTDCGPGGEAELSDPHLDDLVRYVSLLGVRARRGLDDPTAVQGETLFGDLGCAACHVPEVTTSAFHPFSELRSQTIHPYTDLLLHDLGEGLADQLETDDVSASEWRTPPLWGLGLGPCVTGGVEGPFQEQVCTPHASYLHDGRARTVDEAIRWHGGEAEDARAAYEALSDGDQVALLAFLDTL